MRKLLMFSGLVAGLLWIAASGASVKAQTPPAVEARECRSRGGLPNVIKKLETGGEVRIAYLGGSITEAPGWRVLSLEWFRRQYPKARVSEVHAAISGTGAELGACRLGRDVLRHRPDLLFVEFAVNGAGRTERRMIQTMEGIVRQTRRQDPTTDICFVYTLGSNDLRTVQRGLFQHTASVYERVAERYGIPSIHLALEVARLEKEGKLIFKGQAAAGGKILFSQDGIHPQIDTGHPFYLAAIVRSMPSLKAAGTAGPHPLPPPLEPGNWERAQLVPLSRIQRSPEWGAMNPRIVGLTPNIDKRQAEHWQASRPGAATFRFRGTALGLYGLKGADAARFSVTVDDRPPVVGRMFDGTCVGDRYRVWPWILQEDLPPGEHRVKVEVLAADTKTPAATTLYLADVMLVGELLPDRD